MLRSADRLDRAQNESGTAIRAVCSRSRPARIVRHALYADFSSTQVTHRATGSRRSIRFRQSLSCCQLPWGRFGSPCRAGLVPRPLLIAVLRSGLAGVLLRVGRDRERWFGRRSYNSPMVRLRHRLRRRVWVVEVSVSAGFGGLGSEATSRQRSRASPTSARPWPGVSTTFRSCLAPTRVGAADVGREPPRSGGVKTSALLRGGSKPRAWCSAPGLDRF